MINDLFIPAVIATGAILLIAFQVKLSDYFSNHNYYAKKYSQENSQAKFYLKPIVNYDGNQMFLIHFKDERCALIWFTLASKGFLKNTEVQVYSYPKDTLDLINSDQDEEKVYYQVHENQVYLNKTFYGRASEKGITEIVGKFFEENEQNVITDGTFLEEIEFKFHELYYEYDVRVQ